MPVSVPQPATTGLVRGAVDMPADEAVERVLPMSRRDRFDYKWIRGDYQLINGKVRPFLSTIDHTPGRNGVPQPAKGRRPSIANPVGRAKMRGDVHIELRHCPGDFTPDGQPGYRRRYRARGGYAFLPAWQQPRVVRGRVTFVVHDKFYEWLDWLMDEGIIPHPDEQTIEELSETARDRLAGVMDAADRRGALDREASVSREQIAQIEQSLPAAKPKGKRGAK